MMRTDFALLTILAVVILAIGCSGGQDQPPVSPLNPGTGTTDISSQNFSIPFEPGPHSMISAGLIYADPEQEIFEIVPSRDTMLHVNLRRFLEDGAPCIDCFKISGINHQPDDTWMIDLQIVHPWPGYDLFTGFDMRLVIMWDGSEVWPASGLRTQDPDGEDGYIFNADGFTTIFNPTYFPPGADIPLFSYSVGKFATQTYPNATLNPYMDYYSNENRHMMGAGQADTKSWHMRFPSGTFVLGYAIDCSWEAPDVNPPVNLPDDFPLYANKPEPYRVSITQTEMLGDQAGDSGKIKVTSWDWQNDSGTAWIECPELWSGKITAQMTAISPQVKIHYITVTNETGAPAGTYRALIGVPDSSSTVPPWDYTTYKFFDVTVESAIDPCCETPPIAEFDMPEHVITGQEIELVSESYDPDGSDCLVSVSWDLDGDGIYGDSTDETTSVTFDQPGVYQVGLQATDICGLVGDMVKEVIVHVGVNMPEDQDYKTPGTRYNMVSADLPASSTIPDVDLSNPGGPWDFTTLPLIDVGNYRAVLPPDHPEVLSFAGDFTAPFLHFYKTSGILNFVSGSLYMAENYDASPDRIKWVGLHEETIGTFTFFPSLYIEFPYWIFSNADYSVSYPPLLDFAFHLDGWGEGDVTVPLAGIENEPCVVVRYEIGIQSPDVTGSTMVYEWLIDDGTMVAIVAAINSDTEINYDETTGEITGVATYNALNAIEPY